MNSFGDHSNDGNDGNDGNDAVTVVGARSGVGMSEQMSSGMNAKMNAGLNEAVNEGTNGGTNEGTNSGSAAQTTAGATTRPPDAENGRKNKIGHSSNSKLNDPASRKAERLKLWTQAELELTRGLSPEALRTSGLLAAERGAWSAALLRLEEAVYLGIRDTQTLDTLGEAAYCAKAPQALISYRDLYRDPLIASHMARAFLMSGLCKEAEEFLEFARDSLLKRGIKAVLGVKGSIENAIDAMLAPLSDPEFVNLNFIEYWQALGPIASTINRYDLVSLAERRLKALAYDRPVVHFNQSLRFLHDGEFKAGWLLYDWRLSPGSPCASETFFAELNPWEGEMLSGKRLLVVLENGWGDQIFALRFIGELMKENCQIDIAAKPEMMNLLRASFPECEIHKLPEANDLQYWSDWSRRSAQALPDFWTYAFSIPARADLNGLIGREGYLRTQPDLLARTQQLIRAVNPGRLPVRGLVWHGDIRTKPMRTRAYSLREFLDESKILSSPCVLICLQKDVTQEELALLTSETQRAQSFLLDASSDLQDFAHTAAWISSVDRMWSCDTACAHLGGALATPTTVLIRNKDIWHWRSSQPGQSDWYESVTTQDAFVPKYSYMFDIREA